jgi:hypothetical protein
MYLCIYLWIIPFMCFYMFICTNPLMRMISESTLITDTNGKFMWWYIDVCMYLYINISIYILQHVYIHNPSYENDIRKRSNYWSWYEQQVYMIYWCMYVCMYLYINISIYMLLHIYIHKPFHKNDIRKHWGLALSLSRRRFYFSITPFIFNAF